MWHETGNFVRSGDEDAPQYMQSVHRERQEFETLMLLIIGQAAQDAAGMKGAASDMQTQIAQRWFLSQEGNGWLFSPGHPGFVVIRGVTFRWICVQFGIDPDIAQETIRQMTWREWNDRCVAMTRQLRRGPETKPRAKQIIQKASGTPRRRDRRSGDVKVARCVENGSTALVEALR